jgi:hypothetical protein
MGAVNSNEIHEIDGTWLIGIYSITSDVWWAIYFLLSYYWEEGRKNEQ